MIGYPAKAKDLTLPSAKLTEVTAVVRSRHACTTGGERDGRRLSERLVRTMVRRDFGARNENQVRAYGHEVGSSRSGGKWS